MAEPAPRTLRSDVAADLRAKRGIALLGVVALLAWMAFQWGFGNDVILPTISARAFEAVDDAQSWGRGISAVGAAALAGSLFWAATQLIDAVVVLTGLRLLPRVADRVSRWLRSKNWVKPYDEMRLGTRWAISYLAGASVVCLVDVMATGRQGLAGRWPMVAQTVALSAGSIALIVAAVTAAAMAALRVPRLEPAAEVFIAYASNPLTWIVIIGGALAVGHLRASD